MLCVSALLGACRDERRRDDPVGRVRVVFKHQPLWGDPGVFRAVLRDHARENPGVDVVVYDGGQDRYPMLVSVE